MTTENNSNLSSRIIFTIFCLIIFRIGSFIPIAGVNSLALAEIAERNQGGILGMFNMLSGGSLARMSIFALAIMPYITASIVIQLLSVAYKPLEDLKNDGERGKKKLNQISRYLTVVIATMHAYGIAKGVQSLQTEAGSVVVVSSLFFLVSAVITLVVGTMFLMWLGEQISAFGIGNGASLIIFIGIVTGLPSAFMNLFEMARRGSLSGGVMLMIAMGVICLIAFVVFMERAQRKVLIQYPKRQVGNKIYGGDATYLPLKLNTAGVIPPIFASSILLLPLTIGNFTANKSELLEWVMIRLSHGKPLYILLYFFLITFFSFFYTAIVFNSQETADNLKKNGAYVPGRRPGRNTAEYFDYLLTRLTVIGSLYLGLVCILPEIIMHKYSLSFALGGTSFLILVNVVLDTFSQIQTYLFANKYEGMMKKMRLKG